MSDNIRLERMKSERTAYFHALSETPEEDAWKKAEEWAEKKGLLKEGLKTRIFGRNTFPAEDPKTHGYGFFITIRPDIEIEKEISVRTIPEGLYAVARCEGIEGMRKKWTALWKWVEKSEYEYIGETEEEYGYELGFEEHLNWYSALVDKSEKKFIFDLMLQLVE